MQQGQRAGFLQYLSLQPFPKREGKAARIRHSGCEGARHQYLTHTTAAERGVAALTKVWRLVAYESVALGAPVSGCELRHFRHEAAAADAPFNEALGMKLRIGGFYRVARNAQRCRKRARGWERLSGTNCAVKDQLPDRPLYPRMERHRRMGRMGEPCLHGFELRVPEQMV
ncbi:hypothetical protein GCM10017635_12770 [Paracoccus kondratievae]|uniref:Uncharacterized protein n=1 Tax=Paracoccus kondratievae TaxID=135740 RepID=A0AAD3NWA5_9RHOB|nr:hypothetical protein GCM10017635_12770 [Paracoccus kondratievae]